MKVILSPGDTLRVEFSETDEYFEIDYGGQALTVYADYPDDIGRDKTIWCSAYHEDVTDTDELEEVVTDGAQPDLTKPWCYTIPIEQDIHLTGGYVPSLIVEDDPNQYPMLGRGAHSLPWTWGKDLSTALNTCREVNERQHVDMAEHDRIMNSSIRASFSNATVQDIPED